MGRRGLIIGAGLAVPALAAGATYVEVERALGAKPPQVTGSVTVRVVDNGDAAARRFLDDVHRADHSFLSMPGVAVEARIDWRLPHALDGDCQLMVVVLPDTYQQALDARGRSPFPKGLAWARMGATTGGGHDVSVGSDVVLLDALSHAVPGLDTTAVDAYIVDPDTAEGSITFVDDVPDAKGVDVSAMRAWAVVECVNHADPFNQYRNVGGDVTVLPVSA